MAIYRFRVAFEDYDGFRHIDIRSNQTFEDLHYAIHQSIGYKADYPSSFYVSNDQWHKGEEITIFPNEKRKAAGVRKMEETKLSRFIDDPHQKFYYTFNFDRPLDFHVELIRIIMDEDPNIEYPHCVKSSGEPPRQFDVTLPPDPGSDFDGEEPDADEENKMDLEEFGIDEGDQDTQSDGDDVEITDADGTDIDFEDGDEDEY